MSIAKTLRYLVRRHPLLYRLRYRLRLRPGAPSLFTTAPTPGSDSSPPDAFRRKLAEFELGEIEASFEHAQRIAYLLSRGNRRGPGMGVSSTEALRRIYSEKAGVCSDYAQVFLGLCTTAGIPCREWGVCETLEGGGVGHAFNEVYCQRRGKWVFLDPFCSVWASGLDSDEPLSTAEMIDTIADGGTAAARVHTIDPEGCSVERREGYLERYFLDGRLFFLQTNNDPFAQDAILDRAHWLPLPALHGLLILGGLYQRFEAYTNDRNRVEVTRRLAELRRSTTRDLTVLGAAAAAVLVAIASLGRLVMGGPP